MERTLSQEEKQRRAEELYYRRQNSINTARTTTVNVSPRKNYKLLKKVIIQIIICIGIYTLIYKLQTNADSFSVDSVDFIRGAMSHDINMGKTFEDVKNYMTTFNLSIDENNVDTTNTVENNISEEAVSSNVVQEATLSASEQVVEETDAKTEEASSVSQMEEDAEYIKNNFSFIKPITGTVTSRFGLRNPTTATVPKYHTGIDIGVSEGTVFVSAMEGTVELVSSVGDYRKPYKDNKWRCNYSLCSL